MAQMSIFDLLQTADTPKAQDLQRWIASMFPKANDRASFQLAVQLEKLFEMAVFENQIDTVHLLLQQGIPPDIRGDWGTTPLMWANCLGYTQIVKLLIAYGADQYARSFSGKLPANFREKSAQELPEYQAIQERLKIVHSQVKEGYLKPFGSTSSTSSGTPRTKPNTRKRQIDNGKGVDEVFKNIEEASRRTREINLVFE